MLTGDLVRARLQRGVLVPTFVDPASPRLQERAEELLEAFRAHRGRRREELDEAVKAIAGDGVDHKLTTGLAKVLLDRSTFDVQAAVPPVELRARVFREAARRGPLAARLVEGGPPTAESLWAAVGAELGHSAEVLAASLYADHADQQVLLDTEAPSPTWLLHRYNLALVQAILLRSVELRIDLVSPSPGRARQLARSLKFHQLLFRVTPTDDGYRLVVDGPTSLFGQTTRYGLALARAFPCVPLHPKWRASADVRWGDRDTKLELSDASGLVSHYRERGAYETREATWFAERFEALGSGWSLVREAEPLRQGPDDVVVPDFTFHKDGRVAHLEILGFWRKGSVARRLELLARYGPRNLVVAASRKLCADKEEALPEAVVPFAEVIPAKEVLRRVEELAC